MIADILERKSRCPESFALAQIWHAQVKRDAEREQPVTHHGRLVRASSRPWPGVGLIGECACGSSLVHTLEAVDEEEAAAAA